MATKPQKTGTKTKEQKWLDSRVHDWAQTLERLRGKKGADGYRKPGSLNRHG